MTAGATDKPIQELSTPCPACNGTVVALRLVTTTALYLEWHAECSACGAILRVTAVLAKKEAAA